MQLVFLLNKNHDLYLFNYMVIYGQPSNIYSEGIT